MIIVVCKNCGTRLLDQLSEDEILSMPELAKRILCQECSNKVIQEFNESIKKAMEKKSE